MAPADKSSTPLHQSTRVVSSMFGFSARVPNPNNLPTFSLNLQHQRKEDDLWKAALEKDPLVISALERMLSRCKGEGLALQERAREEGRDIRERSWTWEEVVRRVAVEEENWCGTLSGGRRGRKRGWEDDDEDFDQDGIRVKRMRDDGESDGRGRGTLREVLEDSCEQTSAPRSPDGKDDDETGEVRGRKRKREGSEQDEGGQTSFDIVLR